MGDSTGNRPSRTRLGYSSLQQRLLYMDAHPERRWTNLIENVPSWPSRMPLFPPIDPAAVEYYAAAQGQPSLRTAICERELVLHGVRVDPSEVLVTNGAVYALALIFGALVRGGGFALVQRPVLGGIPAMLRRFGYEVAFFDVDRNGMDLDAVRKACAGREVRLVYVNSPNNPSGEILSATALESVKTLVNELDTSLVADLAYDGFVHEPIGPFSPLACGLDPNRLYVVNSMSKNFGAPGLRTGWTISSASNIQRLGAVLELETICMSGPGQQLAAQLLVAGNRELTESVRERKSIVEGLLRTIPGVRFTPPQGGTQVFVDLGIEDADGLCQHALVEHGLALISASHYEGAPPSFVRFPLGILPELARRGLSLLEQALRSYRPQVPCAHS